MYFIYEGTNRLTTGGNSNYDDMSSFQYLKYGEVVENVDEFGLGRIKVRIKGSQSAGGDDGVLDGNLPFAFPMIPKYFSSVPKVGEMVWIFVFDKYRQHADRIYVGPIISQLDKLNKDEARLSAMRGFTFGPTTPRVNVNTIPQLIGIFPDLEDISIQGRYNTDITQKTNEIILRAGKFETSTPNDKNPYNFQFNTKTQGYIQIKNDTSILSPSSENTTGENGTITTIVSNKINLITHKEGSPRFNVTGQDQLISDEEMGRILEEAHQLPFGDVLIEYLKLLKEALFAHVHNGNGNPATDLAASGNKLALATFKSKADDLEKSMLSKNIRIN
jgi:hypothetical protein